MTDKIFVQIAAYRDPELLPTIRDLIRRADAPEYLTFAIAWQHSKDDEWDTLEEFHDDPRFSIIDIDYKESLGTCWARHLLNQEYCGEAYTLQLDSHHRFVRGWDTKLKEMHARLVSDGYPKPLLTSYIASYDPENDPAGRVREVWKLNFDRFIPEGAVFMLPAAVDTEIETKPIPTRFFSAHFMFTTGDFIREVPYDPNLYFHGEEITMAVRAYTSGYDLFIPNEIVAWHEYTRKGRVRHWDENSKWAALNTSSLRRVKELLGIDGMKPESPFGAYGLGSARDLYDYEVYAGIRFSDRAVQRYTLKNFDPPNPTYATIEAFEDSYVNLFTHCLDVYKPVLEGVEDYDFWAVIFEDEQGQEIYREDAWEEEIRDYMSRDGEWVNIWRSFPCTKVPYRWIVWPYSRGLGWRDRIEGVIPQV